MKRIALLLMAVLLTMPMMAQDMAKTKKKKSETKTEVKAGDEKVYEKDYDEKIDAIEQIDQALERAEATGRKVICQVGGNWCPWCLRFADFITKDAEIARLIADNFIYIHVNYNPRGEKADPAKAKQAAKMMQRLGNPGRFGYPVFVVLDAKGKVLHTQDSSFLEEGQGYNQSKVLRFFRNWTPKAVKG